MSAFYYELIESYALGELGVNADGEEIVPHESCGKCGRPYTDLEYVALCPDCRRKP